MKLSRLTDYGIVLMAQLARTPGAEPRNARQVAAEAHVPLPVAQGANRRPNPGSATENGQLRTAACVERTIRGGSRANR